MYDLSKKKEDQLQQLLKIVQAIRFTWQSAKNRFVLRIYDHDGMDQMVVYVSLTPQAATMLDYDTLGPIRDWNQAKYLPDMQGGVSHLAVYLGGPNRIGNLWKYKCKFIASDWCGPQRFAKYGRKRLPIPNFSPHNLQWNWSNWYRNSDNDRSIGAL